MANAQDFHVGLVGAGIGGMFTAIALRKAGARVTVLEAASELGEIGAGIQMTPNVARLLRKYGIADAIGDNLVRFEELNMRRWDGTKIGYTPISRVEQAVGQPWWLVHRAHLHAGLVDVARKEGATLVVDAKVKELQYEPGPQTKVTTEKGDEYDFDLVIGSDGLNSVVRRSIFPNVQPQPPTTNCAYRAIVPYEEMRKDPLARQLIPKLTMEVWMGPGAYIITYPISNGRDFNLVISHHRPEKVRAVEPNVPVDEMRSVYKGWDPRITRVLEMIPEVSRWPLLVMPPLPRWYSPQHNVALLGDAAHSMTNHMAQGAATSMEDGAFLARCIAAYLNPQTSSPSTSSPSTSSPSTSPPSTSSPSTSSPSTSPPSTPPPSSRLTLPQALHLYHSHRAPLARTKQTVSFLNGLLWMIPDGPLQRARDEAMGPELRGEGFVRSPNLYGDPRCVLEVYGYDAEAHAEEVVRRELGLGDEVRGGEGEGTELVGDAVVSRGEWERWVGWLEGRAGGRGLRGVDMGGSKL